jgi:cell division protein ZapD
MHNETIIFQLATHYLPKIALRLECLFLTIEQACEETHPVVHHYALKNIIEIIKLIEKPELKSRFLKEFMRIEHAITKSQTIIPNTLYADLFIQIQHLTHVVGRFGDSIHNDPFLQSIRLAQTISQSDFELHSPQLLLWLENKALKRQDDLTEWLKQLRTLYDTVAVYLALLRDTAEFDKIDMFNGFYQRSLPSKTSCHLILLRMDKHCGIVPRMQLGHHGLSLRLCEASSMHEIRRTDTNIDLAICQL